MTRETFERMGTMNELLINYFSDREYHDRANKLNIPVVKWTDVLIEHKESSTFKNLDKNTIYQADHETYLKLTTS
jgi:GT2 family glycosyltransferase